MYICICIYVYVYLSLSIYIYIFIHISIYISLYICIYAYIYIYIYLYLYQYLSMYMYIYIYTHTYMHRYHSLQTSQCFRSWWFNFLSNRRRTYHCKRICGIVCDCHLGFETRGSYRYHAFNCFNAVPEYLRVVQASSPGSLRSAPCGPREHRVRHRGHSDENQVGTPGSRSKS